MDASDVEMMDRGKDAEMPEPTRDGCVILRHRKKPDEDYMTEFRIDHDATNPHICQDIFYEECVPFCAAENRRSAKWCLWNFVKSEAFLFTLHVGTVVLGAVKEAMGFRTVAETLHLVHSIIETFLAFLQTLIRLISAWMTFRALKRKFVEAEHVDPDKLKNRSRNLKTWLNIVTVICVLMLVGVVACFLIFYYLVHLGWTLLSNQFAMISVTTACNLFQARCSGVLARITEDHHKVVLYDAVSFMVQHDAELSDDAKTFIAHLMDSPEFSLPSHIMTTDQNIRNWGYDVSAL